MTDKELVELAAKAADIKGIWHRKGFVAYSGWGKGIFNPLDDDGDALRLAVKIGFVIDRNPAGTIIYAGLWDHPKWEGANVENGDAIIATRRAITRAAAQIGKEME